MTKSNKGDIEFIEALAELLNSKALGEIEVLRQYGEDDALEVRVSKAPQTVYAPSAAPAAAPAPAQAAPPIASVATSSVEPAAVPADHLDDAEKSPMVGTVYLAPEPGAAPFVKIGDSVEAGQTLLIIEAMKTMNQIPASKAGIVKRILIEDNSPVEFGDPLMVIE